MNHKGLQNFLKEIQNLVSCPANIYKQLYLATLSHFIIQCPAHQINQRLTLSIFTLRLRRGILLPKNAGAEAIAAEEAQWTYALFSGALLKGLEYDLITRIIPDLAESWLSNNSHVFVQWKEILLNAVKENNYLNNIIGRANELSKI